jgi:hypothetical protein
MESPSPFDDAENVVCYVHRRIVEEGRPILVFARGVDEPVYHALTGDEVEGGGVDDVAELALSQVFDIDPTIGELFDLEPGWWALRDAPDGEWYREPIPESGEADE